MTEINFESIKNALRNQSKYDYLRTMHWVEMDKVVNQYTLKSSGADFVPFENIASFRNFANITGPSAVADLFRFFNNVDFAAVTSWVDELTENELGVLGYTLDNFPFSEWLDINNCTLTDILKSIVGRAKLPEKLTRERIRYEETK